MDNNKKGTAVVKRDTLENWNKAKNYKPAFGTIILVDLPDGNIAIKIGDSELNVNDLPYIVNTADNN